MSTVGSNPEPRSVLALAPGWLLDELSEQRLRHQLDGAPESVAGVAAQPMALPAGATYRAFAARRSLSPLTSMVGLDDGGRIEGAVVLRPGVAHEITDRGIVVDAGIGSVLVDPGAHVHDPWSDVDAAESATPLARSPFPRRPVLVFLGCDVEGEPISWAQSLANDLVDHDVDACLAVPVAADGYHLSRPCRPDRPSIEALDPDVVIPLDDTAAGALPDWLDGDRHTVIVETSSDEQLGVQLISWRLGEARGRVRARVGRGVQPLELAHLVNRLCSGPSPIPPSADLASLTGTEWREGASAVLTTIRPRGRLGGWLKRQATFMAVDASPGGERSTRLAGLVTHLRRMGHRVDRRARFPDAPLDNSQPDTLILHDVAPTEQVLVAIDRRRRAGQPSVVHLGPADVEVGAGQGPDSIRLSDQAMEIVRACRMVIAPSRRVADLIDEPDVRVIDIPTLLDPRKEIERPPRAVSSSSTTSASPILGWRVDRTPPAEMSAVEEALGRLLEVRPNVSLELTGPQADVVKMSERLAPLDLVTVVSAAPGSEAARTWTAQVWTVDPLSVYVSGDVAPLVDAGHRGVPSVISAMNPGATLAGHPRSLVVHGAERATSWLDALLPIVDDEETHDERSSEVARSTRALFGEHASALVVNRLVGWLGGLTRHAA